MAGRLHTCYSPVRRSPADEASFIPAAPRLACVRPVASVHPEPGSNSPLFYLVLYNFSVSSNYLGSSRSDLFKFHLGYTLKDNWQGRLTGMPAPLFSFSLLSLCFLSYVYRNDFNVLALFRTSCSARMRIISRKRVQS